MDLYLLESIQPLLLPSRTQSISSFLHLQLRSRSIMPIKKITHVSLYLYQDSIFLSLSKITCVSLNILYLLKPSSTSILLGGLEKKTTCISPSICSIIISRRKKKQLVSYNRPVSLSKKTRVPQNIIRTVSCPSKNSPYLSLKTARVPS